MSTLLWPRGNRHPFNAHLDYTECHNDSPVELKAQRGSILEKSTGKVLVHSFGYNDLYTLEDVELIQDILSP